MVERTMKTKQRKEEYMNKGINTTLKILGECSIYMLLFFSCLTVTAQTLTPEQTLESVKQGLVDFAMVNEIQINSTAYLDNGILHESLILSSQAVYRGVPALLGLKDKGATGNQDAAQSETCPESRMGLRREALFSIDKDDAVFTKHNSLGDHSFSELATFIGKIFSARMQGSKSWVVAEEKEYGSGYDGYVLGSGAVRAPYRFEIKIRPRTSKGSVSAASKEWFNRGVFYVQGAARRVFNNIPGGPYRESWPSAQLEYQLTLIDRATQLAVWQQSMPLDFPEVKRDYLKSQLPNSLINDIEVLTERFIQGATGALQCEPHRFQLFVDKVSGGLEINAGLVAGINVGDKFLISTSSDLLEEVLTNPKLDTLALARVESVDDHSAMLKKIAGPSWPATNDISKAIATYF
jgi:hypothetical protein